MEERPGERVAVVGMLLLTDAMFPRGANEYVPRSRWIGPHRQSIN